MIIRNKIVGFLSAVFVAQAAAFAQGDIAIMNGRVLTGDGAAIENGDIIIRNGRIAQIGADLSAPAGATVINADGKVVTPGIFAPVSDLGLSEIELDGEGNDSGPYQQVGFPLGAALDASDAIRNESVLIPINRAGGVTRAVVAPSPGDSLFGGRAAIIDLSGRANSVTRARIGQVLALGYSGAARAGDTRLGAWALLRETLDEARSYSANPNDYVRRSRAARHSLADLKALGPVVSGEQPLLVNINGVTDIRTLIRVKNEYGLKVVIIGGSEAWKAARALASANIPVILNPAANLPNQFEDLGSTLENAARLHAAGVKIAFTGTSSGNYNLTALRQLAGVAVANGLPYEAAIEALTSNPAEIYGLDASLGDLSAGKIADVVIWDGDPLEVTSAAEAVFINGVRQDLDSRPAALLRRYRDLSRAELPFAYRGD